MVDVFNVAPLKTSCRELSSDVPFALVTVGVAEKSRFEPLGPGGVVSDVMCMNVHFSVKGFRGVLLSYSTR